MKITVELLKEKGACSSGIKAFTRLFPQSEYPDGVEINAETVEKAAKAKIGTSLIWWVYNNVQQDARLYALCGVNKSNGVNLSDGVSGSYGVSGSFGILNSFGVDHALFLADKKKTYSIFGKSVSKKRFEDVKDTTCCKVGGRLTTISKHCISRTEATGS